MQILALSDADLKWRTYSMGVEREVEGKRYNSFGKLLFSENGELYCLVSSQEEGDDGYYLGKCGDQGLEEIVCAVPKEMGIRSLSSFSTEFPDNILDLDKAGNAYHYLWNENVFTCLDGQMQPQRKVTPDEWVQGILQADPESEVYWYGQDAEHKIVIRNVATGDTLLEGFGGVSAYGYAAEYSDEGILFLADSQSIWKVDGEPEQVYHFSHNDYIVDTLYGMTAGEGGEMLLLVRMEGSYRVLTLQESISPPPSEADKQEIVISFINEHLALNRVIAQFNRQSGQYHVSVVLAEEDENGLDYADRMQLEVSVGRGPDILERDVVQDITAYMENGYLECLDGVLEDESQYLQAALETCRYDGKLYGMPYDFMLEFAAYPGSFAAGRTSFSMQQFMEAVRDSDAKILEGGCSGMDIVMRYGLYDDSNTAYIDWARGESHLSEEPFLELLAFAKEYGDTGKVAGTPGGLIASGEAIAVEATMSYLNSVYLPAIDDCFQGDAAIIGYPRAEGNGIYANSRALYVNANSDCKEGVREFLRYLMSEEIQRQYYDPNLYEQTGVRGYRPQFPVHMGAYDALMELAMQPREGKWFSYPFGIEYEVEPYTEEQVEEFYFLLEHAQPGGHNAAATGIRRIIDEELAPYFAGEITAEQAAKVLDNRVQLYLDERGDQ